MRSLQDGDVVQATEIIRASPGAAQWTVEDLCHSLETGCRGWAMENDGKIAGVLIGRMVADEFEILNLAVAQEHRHQGIASTLLDAALASAKSEECKTAHLEVRASNAPAIALYRRGGFAEAGRRKEYYQNPAEDAALFKRFIAEEY